MSSISQYLSKIKGKIGGKGDEALLVAIILLIALTAFGLGRLSAGEKAGGVKITQKVASTTTTALAKSHLLSRGLSGGVITSKHGSAYHLPWCPGAEQIDPENIQWFASPRKAREAGYRPAKNCKGI